MRYGRQRYKAGDPIKDRFNNDVKIGDFISYILYHQGGGSMGGIFYGHVTNIGKTGKVTAKSIKISTKCRVIENTVTDVGSIIKMPESVEKAWLNHVLINKLSES